jgi:hypothetical protein
MTILVTGATAGFVHGPMASAPAGIESRKPRQG